MKYEESKKILEKIGTAENILINCHRNPDPDSIGGAISMYRVLKGLGKSPRIICPTGVSNNFVFLKDFEKIETVDFSKFDFAPYDLMVCIDSASWGMVAGSEGMAEAAIEKVVIDHHKTNTKYGLINLVDPRVNSVAEVLYRLYQDWGAKLDKETATALLTGIIGDTGSFRFPGTTGETLEIAAKLLKSGADRDKINLNIYFSLDKELIGFWAELLADIEVDKEYSFAWAAAPYELFEKYGKPVEAKERLASELFQSIKGTNFGIVMVETEEKNLSVSLRSRTGFDVSKIAVALGGGGHMAAAGARIENLSFEKAVTKVLETARKYAKKN